MEGYFVRTSGCTASTTAPSCTCSATRTTRLRKVIRDTIEFDPEILKRYVNFMTNPDEETAIGSSGRATNTSGSDAPGDVAGAAMIGMARSRASQRNTGWSSAGPSRRDPERGLVARFEAEIVPLLQSAGGSPARPFPAVRRRDRARDVAENVLRLFERSRPRPIAHRLPQHVRLGGRLGPRIRAVASRRRRPEDTGRSTLADALELGGGGRGRTRAASLLPRCAIRPRVPASIARFAARGLFVELDAIAASSRRLPELRDSADAPWSRLAESRGSRRSSLDEACPSCAWRDPRGSRGAPATGLEPDEIESRRDELLELVAPRATDRPTGGPRRRSRWARPGVRAAVCFADRSTTFDRFRFGAALRRAGLGEDDVRGRGSPSSWHTPPTSRAPPSCAGWLADGDVRTFLGVNDWKAPSGSTRKPSPICWLWPLASIARAARGALAVIGRLRRSARQPATRSAIP